MMRRIVAWTLLLLAVAVLPASAQMPLPIPPGPACDLQLRATRINLNATTMTGLRERREFTDQLAVLQVRVEQLEAELAALKAKKEPGK